MKTKEELEKEYRLLCGSDTMHKAKIHIKLPNGIQIEKEFDLKVVLHWAEGVNGNVWIHDPGKRGSGMLCLNSLEEEINKLYDLQIQQFCKKSDEFEAAGGVVSWF